ncbi:MAG: cold-shock protein [Pseudohongiella sp.]|nr:cold-shock protein [Pseudohongiella sp.]MDO9521780.1 cold-shock protein [Pseudohongiella sp.]MDP2128392.1 cold-shock protein [Pseudohongiella sp.]
MSRKILSSALLVSIVSIPFVYLLATQIDVLGVPGQLIATLAIVYFASAGSAWLSVRVVQSGSRAAKGGRKPARPAASGREKPNRSPETQAVAEGPREAGQVKWFNASKGFGFITRDTGEDIFVHFRSIRGDGHRVLKDGQRVEFSVSMGDKGLQADDVAALAR